MRRTALLLASLVAMLIVGLMVAGTAGAGSLTTFTVRAETNYNSVDRKDKNVFCPEGSEVQGGGAKIVDARKFVKLETSRPLTERNGWRGVAVENKHETHKKWKLVVYARCQGLPLNN